MAKDFLTDEEMSQLETPSQEPKDFITESEMATLESKSMPSLTESVIRGGLQGLSGGFIDEAEAGIRAGKDLLTGQVPLSGLKEDYYKRKEDVNAAYRAAEEANPIPYGGARLGGAIASPVNKLGLIGGGIAMGVGAAGEGLESSINQGLLGGTLGALGGAAGRVISKTAPAAAGFVSKQVPQAIKGAGIGLGGSIGGPLGGVAGYKAAKELAPKIQPAIQSGIEKVKNLIQNNPMALGRFLPALQSSLQRGDEAFRANLFVLQQREPEFRQLMEGSDE